MVNNGYARCSKQYSQGALGVSDDAAGASSSSFAVRTKPEPLAATASAAVFSSILAAVSSSSLHVALVGMELVSHRHRQDQHQDHLHHVV